MRLTHQQFKAEQHFVALLRTRLGIDVARGTTTFEQRGASARQAIAGQEYAMVEPGKSWLSEWERIYGAL